MTPDELLAWLESDDGPLADGMPATRRAQASLIRGALIDGDAARRVAAAAKRVRAVVREARGEPARSIRLPTENGDAK